jgi:protein-disulfide isomerase
MYDRRTLLALPLLATPLALAAGPALAAPGVAAPGDMSLGNPRAPVKVVEYASLSCPHCAHFNEAVFPTLKAKYIDTGKVYYTLKEYLTEPAQVAAAGFLMARCAGPAKYFTVVDQVFRSQARWKGDLAPIFAEIAKANGLTQEQFEACLSDEKASAALNARAQAAYEVDKVNSTPTIFVNGKDAGDAGATLPGLEAAIVAALKTRRR